MNIDPTPTIFEREMADMRASLAHDAQAAIAQCIESCGPGAVAYAYWVVIDKLGIIPMQKIPTCRRADDNGWMPPAPNPLERLDTSSYSTVDGTKYYPFRFTVSFESLSEYRPKTAEQLATARAAREGKLLGKLKDELVMFPELVPGIAAKLGTPGRIEA